MSSCALLSEVALEGAIPRRTRQGPHLGCGSMSPWTAFSAVPLPAKCTQSQGTFISHKRLSMEGPPPPLWGNGILVTFMTCIFVWISVRERVAERQREGHWLQKGVQKYVFIDFLKCLVQWFIFCIVVIDFDCVVTNRLLITCHQ